jgi:hypothetical protein
MAAFPREAIIQNFDQKSPLSTNLFVELPDKAIGLLAGASK